MQPVPLLLQQLTWPVKNLFLVNRIWYLPEELTSIMALTITLCFQAHTHSRARDVVPHLTVRQMGLPLAKALPYWYSNATKTLYAMVTASTQSSKVLAVPATVKRWGLQLREKLVRYVR